MRGLNLQQMQQQPQQSQNPISSFINPQTLGALMQAYQASQGGPVGASPGATGTDYAGLQMQGTGFGLGQPIAAGGQSGQSQQGHQGLLQAMMQARQMGQ